MKGYGYKRETKAQREQRLLSQMKLDGIREANSKKDILYADDKVGEMMFTPMNQLPELALNHLKWLSSRLGFCGEICVSAYYNYCQYVLKLPLKDKNYKISEEDTNWFKENYIPL